MRTPCVKVCVIDARTEWCIGCGRDRAEIASWAALDDAGRDAVMAALPERLSRMTSRAARGRRTA